LTALKPRKYSERQEKLVFNAIRPSLIDYAIPLTQGIADKANRSLEKDWGNISDLTDIARDNRFYRIIFTNNI
jgi:hypothetical protein